MYRLLSREEAERLLAPYGGRYAEDAYPGCERWETDRGLSLWLTPEYDGKYDEFMVLEAIEKSIKPGGL